MKSVRHGSPISAPELTNVSARGVWLLLDGREIFLEFVRYPWLRNGTIGQLANIARPSADHLHWPDLDVDITVESIDAPERFPLRSKVLPGPMRAAVRERPTKR